MQDASRPPHSKNGRIRKAGKSLIEKTCARCGAFFRTRHGRRRFCSLACGQAHRRVRRPRLMHHHVCIHCGGEWESQRKNVNQHKDCANKAKNENRRRVARNADSSRANLSKHRIVECTRCKQPFLSKRAGTRYCSPACQAEQQLIKQRATYTRECRTCGSLFTPLTKINGRRPTRCSIECEQVAESFHDRAMKALRRARQRISTQSVDRVLVFTVQRWICQLCGKQTKPELNGTCEDLAPELDHIVPLSQGGAHTYENVQTACRQCNLIKGGRGR